MQRIFYFLLTISLFSVLTPNIGYSGGDNGACESFLEALEKAEPKDWRSKREILRNIRRHCRHNQKLRNVLIDRLKTDVEFQDRKSGSYRTYMNDLCLEIGQFEDLNENVLRILLRESTYLTILFKQTKRIIPWLIKVAEGEDVELKERAIWLLAIASLPQPDECEEGCIKPEDVLTPGEKQIVKPILLKSLSERNSRVRMNAAMGLGGYVDSEDVKNNLRKTATQDPDKYVREEAQKVLEELKKEGKIKE